MKDTKHTPGPWKSAPDFMGPDTYSEGDAIAVFPANGGVCICEVVARNGQGISRPDIQAQAEANARLIASAPELLADNERLREVNAELLEALQYAESVLTLVECTGERQIGNGVCLDVVRKAIAKANQP